MTTPGNFDASLYPEDVTPEEAPFGFVRLRAVCRTEGCPGQDRPLSVTVYNNADGRHRIICGGCGKPPETREEKPDER